MHLNQQEGFSFLCCYKILLIIIIEQQKTNERCVMMAKVHMKGKKPTNFYFGLNYSSMRALFYFNWNSFPKTKQKHEEKKIKIIWQVPTLVCFCVARTFLRRDILFCSGNCHCWRPYPWKFYEKVPEYDFSHPPLLFLDFLLKEGVTDTNFRGKVKKI